MDEYINFPVSNWELHRRRVRKIFEDNFNRSFNAIVPLGIIQHNIFNETELKSDSEIIEILKTLV